MGSNKPLVMARPERGREMKTQHIADQESGKTTLMHEGYVGGHKYLVPDEDLDVMKELVDYRLGQKPKDHYVRDYDYTHQMADADEKFRKMSNKLQQLDSDETDDTDTTGSSPTKKRVIRFDDDPKSITSNTSGEDSKSGKKGPGEGGNGKKGPGEGGKSTDDDDDDDDDSSGTPTTVSSTTSTAPSGGDDKNKSGKGNKPETSSSSKTSSTSQSSKRTMPFETQWTVVGADSVRFFISGHFRNNQRPIFIFHKFTGKSPFGKKPDFFSKKNEGDVDLYISGKFYQDSVLQEVNDKLISLNIMPDKIMINENCKVFEDHFYELLHVGDVAVEFEGKFIRQEDTKKFTPFLAFNVQNVTDTKRSSRDYESTKKPPTAVYIANAEPENIFAHNQKKQERVISDRSVHSPKRAVVRKEVLQTPSAPKPEDGRHEYEPHLKRSPPSKKPSMKHSASARRGKDAGDVGSDGALVYHCDVTKRKSSAGSRNFFRRLSQMFSKH